MNDRELDEMLNEWEAPAMRESVREELRAGFAARPRVRRRAGLLRRLAAAAGGIRIRRVVLATAGAAVLVFAIVQIAPPRAGMASRDFRMPFYVEFDFARFANDGAVPHETRITSFPYAGHEIVISAVGSGDSLLNKVHRIANAIRTHVIVDMPWLVLPKDPPMAQPEWFAGFVKSGCTEGKNVVGHERIAGYETTAVQSDGPGNRVTVWMAPELECFALKFTNEVRESNGRYRLSVRKEAVRVKMNP